jgi:hypothetical protein
MKHFTAVLVICILCLTGKAHAQDAVSNEATLYVNIHEIGYFDESPEMKWVHVTDEIELTPIEHGIQFSFHITAPNYHSCRMKGTAIKQAAHYEYREMVRGGECVLKIFVTEDTVRLEDAELVCRTVYCGERGGINGARFSKKQ